MRIALFHNRYSVRGGEGAVVDLEKRLLEEAGHDVFLFEMDNRVGLRGKDPRTYLTLASAPWNRRSGARVFEFLQEHHIEVGHVHNWFPLFSPSVYDAHRAAGVPVVQTLHNYRLGCAAATLVRDGKHCTSCLDGGAKHAVKHGCYRGSKLLTGVWRRTMDRGWRTGAFKETVDAYVAPSEFVRDVHVGLGLPKDLIEVLPHGVEDPRGGKDIAPPGRGAVFVGRLSEEKGLGTLLEAWKGLDVPLAVVGDGPLKGEVERLAASQPGVELLGLQDTAGVHAAVERAAFLVSPHIAPETFGLAIVEAFANGRPVVASRRGAPESIIEDGTTGLLVEPEDPASLAGAVRELGADTERIATMGRAARRVYEKRYAAHLHTEALVGLFGQLLGERASRRAA